MSTVEGRYGTPAYDTFRNITTCGYGSCCTARLGQQLVEPAGHADHDHLGLVRRAVQDLVTRDQDTGLASNPIYATDLRLGAFRGAGRPGTLHRPLGRFDTS